METQKLQRDIEQLQNTIRSKEKEIEEIQANCEHRFPDEWQEKTEKDYTFMSGAVDPVFREKTPRLKIVYIKTCKLCGKTIKKDKPD